MADKKNNSTNKRHLSASDKTSESFRKYRFEDDFFEVGADDAPDADDKNRPLTQEDIAQAESKGYSQGLSDGKAQADEQTAVMVATHLQPVIDSLNDLADAKQEHLDLVKEEALELLKHALDKLLSHAREHYPNELLQKALDESIDYASDQTKLTIYASNSTLEIVQKHIEKNAKDKNITLKSDSSLEAGDCRVEWETGGIENRREFILSEISKLLEAVQNGNKPSKKSPAESEK